MQRQKIKCTICGQEVSKSNYSKHMRRHEMHPETFRPAYVLDHEDLSCKFCGKNYESKNALIQHEMRCSSNPERIQSSCIKNFNAKGRTVWNKGLDKSDARIQKQIATYKERFNKGVYKVLRGSSNPACRPEVRERISKTCLMKSKTGTWHTSLAKNKHIDYNGVDLHCSWELRYAMYLDNNNIPWIRCKDRFPYEYKGVMHYYTPDFYLPRSDEYIEIKGYSTGKDYAKWKQFPKDKTLVVMKKEDLDKLGIDTK